MTQAAITLPGQQSKLALAIAPDKMQSVITVPFATGLCNRTLALEDKTFATSDPTIEDIVSCDGQNLAGEIVKEWRGAFTCSFLGNSQDLGWALAITLGASTAASAVAASTAVYTETNGGTGGSRAIIFDGKPTTQLVWNASIVAIQAAVDALVGAGLWTVSGTPSAVVYTAAGANALNYARRPRVSPASAVTLTGGTSTMALTTAGGIARQSYTITASTADQPPAITAVLGYTNSGKGWQIADLVVNEMTVELQDSGFYRITLAFIWSGLYTEVPSFSWPACATPRKLDIRDSSVLFGAVDKTDALKTLTWTFSNNIQIVYASVSKFGQAFLRQFPLQSTWKTTFQEDPFVAGSVYRLATANTQEGTAGSFTVRVGDPADGGTFANPETVTRLDGAGQAFGGTPPLGRVPALVRAFNSTSAADRPTSVTLLTTYATGFLAAA